MKTRAQTKASIRRKQGAVLRARQRRRQYAVSAAACLLLAFIAWQPSANAVRNETDSAFLTGGYTGVKESASVGLCSSVPDGALTEAPSDDLAYETGAIRCTEESRNAAAQPTDKSYPVRNGGSITDSITVRLPSGEVLRFSADIPAQKDNFTRLSDLLTALQTRAASLPLPASDTAEDEASSMIIERTGETDAVQVTVEGSLARFDDGRQLMLSPEEQQTLSDLLRDMQR